MGWVDSKWFPAYPGDFCSGWYKAPEGVEPIWEFRLPNFEGTLENRPRWVMVNGREIPDRSIAETSGGADCEIERYGKIVPHRYVVASHFCRTHIVFLYTEDHVLRHLKGNKSLFGQLLKEGIVCPIEAPKVEASEIEVPEAIATKLRELIQPVVVRHEKLVPLWKQGKTGPLIGIVIKATEGKYEGKHIEKVLKEILGGITP